MWVGVNGLCEPSSTSPWLSDLEEVIMLSLSHFPHLYNSNNRTSSEVCCDGEICNTIKCSVRRLAESRHSHIYTSHWPVTHLCAKPCVQLNRAAVYTRVRYTGRQEVCKGSSCVSMGTLDLG